MNLLKQNPIFCFLLFAMTAIAAGGLWYLSKLDLEVAALKSRYETKSSQYDRYLDAKPSPNKTNLKTLDDNYASLFGVYKDTLRVMNLNTYDKDLMFGNVPESRADWSFEIHKYIDDARYSAMSNGIELPLDCQFGVTRYARAAPKPEEMVLVHKQVVVMTNVLDSLFDSGIETFVEIERGVAQGEKTNGRTRGKPVRAALDGDEFVVVPDMSVAVPEILDAQTYRVVFTGQSIALRSFINRIMNSSLPYAIRGIEVDLARESGSKTELESFAANPFAIGAATKDNGTGSGVPIVSDNSSRFTVTLEFLELIEEIPNPIFVAEAEGSVEDA